jgi:hypothetical protein
MVASTPLARAESYAASGSPNADVLPVAQGTGAVEGAVSILDAPPPLPRDLPPAPTREPDEIPRRVWEIFPSGGFGTPFCRGNAFGLGHCGDASSGATLGAGALYRVSPYVALGLDASFARFTAKSASGARDESEATWIGVLVRGYFVDHGVIDPYVETGFGQASADARHVEGDDEIRTELRAPSVMTGAGIDFWVAPYLRVGPALNYRFAFVSSVNGCYGATCTAVGIDERGAVGSYASVSFCATLALGHEM